MAEAAEGRERFFASTVPAYGHLPPEAEVTPAVANRNLWPQYSQLQQPQAQQQLKVVDTAGAAVAAPAVAESA